MSLTSFLSLHLKKHLIFDLDCTLAKLNIDWSTYRQELWDTVSTFDKPLTQEVPFEPWSGIELTNKAIQKHGKKVKQILDKFNESYELTHYHGYTANPTLFDFVKKNTTHTLFLWTSNQEKTIQHFLMNEGFFDVFNKIITRDMVTHIKPYPDGFSQIYIPGTDKKDYLMIGDNFTDKEAAASVGIDFFLVDYFDKIS